ncbi:MAG: FixH family protein [Sandaracinobacteroides sp.]
MSKAFTGRKFAAILLGGFGIVVAANLTLAVFASRSHPGMVVANSYVASQKFNGWLAQGRAQKALGWTVDASADSTGFALAATDSRGEPLTGLVAVATLEHPLGSQPSRQLVLPEIAPGRYRAAHDLAPGQWLAEVRLNRGSESYYLPARIVVPG